MAVALGAPPDEKCNGRTRNGSDCRRPAGWGTDHEGVGRCSYHGGKTPSHRKAAAEAMLRRTLAEMDPVPIGDPALRMSQIVEDYNALYLVIRAKVETSKADDWVDGKAAPWLAMLERATNTLQRFLADWVRLGMEERMIRLDERRAELICTVLESALDACGLDAATIARVRPVVGAELAKLGAAA